ncbi:MAG: site-specific DNA-methyltransferase [Desulfovibrio sp.]|jgi:adenine-specific DNA-methyltransferase|nr:site-specific DNA-methyltransferase [Desulfovibrio sp.]
MAPQKSASGKTVETIVHDDSKRLNIPTVELSGVARKQDMNPVQVSYKRRDPDLDPQLVWRGKYGPEGMEDGELLVRAAPLYIQEKVHPKVLIDDLKKESEARAKKATPPAPQQLSLFADFNGIPEGVNKTEFYQHEQNWSNRLILGDSLQVMAGLAEREGLRGKVQAIYFDPPYGIKFNSNFQWSTTNRDVKDNKADHITREPEQVKAFRDTWKDGIHSYLSYIRDRLIVARDLLTDSGSIFVQIGDENVHRVRAVMDEVFGEDNCIASIIVEKTSSSSMQFIDSVADYILWYAKNINFSKFKQLFQEKKIDDFLYEYKSFQDESGYRNPSFRFNKGENEDNIYAIKPLTSQTNASTTLYDYIFRGKKYASGKRQWATPIHGMDRVSKANRIEIRASSIGFVRFFHDFSVVPISNIWTDTGTGSFTDPKVYIVQTGGKIVQRCLLMTTDPGDLVLDPTCGSGTTAYVAEQWGRRWITIDTSRVALALARARLMGARYPYYLLADSPEGQKKEAAVTQSERSSRPTYGKISHGFVYERVPHITLKSIANNTEIDVIWEKWQEKLEPLRQKLNAALGKQWEEWEIPREEIASWPDAAKKLHASWWQARIARQKEIDASIAAKADTEFLYDKPYTDNKKVRVAGPFTVESLSPHRMLTIDENDEIIDPLEQVVQDGGKDFTSMILEELKAAGVQQANKDDKISFTSLKPWAGRYISGEGVYSEGENEKRAAIFIGPEFGSVTRQDLVAAAKEAADADFGVLIACAFNYDAASADLPSLGRMPILKARMNADLHMSAELKSTGKGNLFIIFGEPDIAIEEVGKNQIQVSIKGVDIFDPAKGEVRSDEPDKIACWFIDTDYNEESFFVRHAYFLGANDPYKALQTSLKAEIDREAWESLNSAVSRPFDKPKSGRIAVKVINHLGDEVMKVYRVEE